MKYNAEISFIEEISIPGKPISIAVNKKGELFIGDGLSGKIFRYSKNKATIFYSGTTYPNSLAFSSDNLLYVADSEQKKVLVLDVSANLVRTIGEGDLIFPTGIAVDDANKHVFISEHGGSGTGFSPTVKIMMYDTEGNFIKSFGSHGNTDGEFYRIQGLVIILAQVDHDRGIGNG